MSLRKLTQVAVLASQNVQVQRQVHLSAARRGFFDLFKKPLARQEDQVVGYQKIVMDAVKVGEDPLETQDRDKPYNPPGSGTRADPFLVKSKNTRRYVMAQPPNHSGGTPRGFWVTLEDGGRCPYTGRHYKLDYDPSDKWGINELDLFRH
ncbi:uncharacterized protein LOC143449918 [Clavelina lepadiformis]|uniref:uncharacterized protein LOC143449918 n=1 Tax=Clavelina lepadiformis TaxID=159417 RepID=UPI0040430902